MRLLRLKQSISILIMPWLLSLLIQSTGRLFLLLSSVEKSEIAHHKSDVFNLFKTGLFFDIRISCIAFGILLFLSLFFIFSVGFFKRWTKVLDILNTIILILIAFYTVVNIYYYITYDHHIDVFIFRLITDDTVAVIKTIWSDYPVLWILFELFISMIILFKLVKSWRQFVLNRSEIKHKIGLKSTSIIGNSLIIIAIFILTFIGARGGIGTFPLRESDSYISRYPVFNTFVPNGLIAMDWAYKGYKLNKQFPAVSDEIAQKSANLFYQKETPLSLDMFKNQTKTNAFAEQNPPNVVLSVMESMGSHLFEFDDIHSENKRDLMGALRENFQQDWVFPRFVSEGNGTIDSLSRFFVRSPMSDIGQSSAQKTKFISNMFKPFLDKGYKIIYISGANGAWCNLNQFLPNLGISEYVEETTLLEAFPEAKAGTWGVPDEYMFKYAERRLQQAEEHGEHVFIMMMSITNHPPYHVPDNYSYINYPFTQAKRFKNFDNEKEVLTMLNTFHYSNDQLGKFINWVKRHPTGQNTILAATGDHNLRGIGYPNPKELALGLSVPFYLYVPTSYQSQSHYDKTRIGSHKDIFPTLYQLALSNTDYYQTGCNLLAESLDSTWCNAGYNSEIAIDPKGAYSLSLGTFQPWANETGLLLDDPELLTSQENLTLNRWRAFKTLLDWQLKKQVDTLN